MSKSQEIIAYGFAQNATVIEMAIMQAVRKNDVDMLDKICKSMQSFSDDIETFMSEEEKKLGDTANYIFRAGEAHALLELAYNLVQEVRTAKTVSSQQDEKKDKIVKILFDNEPYLYQDCLRLSGYSIEEFEGILSEMEKDNVRLIQVDQISNHKILLLTKIGRQYAQEKWGTENGED